MLKKAAIFDMDGTLTDTERVYQQKWFELIEESGNKPSFAFTKAVCGSSGEKMKNIISQFYPDVDAEYFTTSIYARVAAEVEKKVPLKAGAREILTYLKECNFKLAVASSSAHEQIEKNMKKAGLFELLDVIVGGDDVAHSKPDPEIVLRSAELMGCKPEECFVFEDGINGIRAGLAAGCSVAMVVDLTEPDDVYAPQCAGIYASLFDAMEAVMNGKLS